MGIKTPKYFKTISPVNDKAKLQTMAHECLTGQ
jgi:hypothetical protein